MWSHASRSARAVYGSMLLLSLLWLGLIWAAPYSMAAGRAEVSIVLYRAFSAVCHQLPERSFDWMGFPLAVCARCTGIYVGVVAGLLLYPWLRRLENPEAPSRWWLIGAAIPMALDFGGGWLGLFANTCSSRAATGAGFGLAAAFYIVPGFVWICRSREVE